MALTKYCFGDLIELSFIRNSEGLYNEDDTIGVNIDKEIRIMKGDSSKKELKTFWIVKPGFFVYNPRGSRKLGLGYNDTSNTYITTFNNMIFRVKDSAVGLLLPQYLFIYLSRKEWDRKAEYLSWGSSTEVFSWDTFCETEIDLPSITVQQKYVDIYNAMLENQRCYERGLEDLKFVCDAYIEDLRRKYKVEEIRNYICELNDRNNDLNIDNVQGVTSASIFDETKANMKGIDLQNYKVVRIGQFAYNPSRINLGSIALLKDNDCIISPMYIVFEVINQKKLLPEYLMMWYGRKEFQRSTMFYATGSVRDTFSFDVMQEVKIPIPEIKIQKSIADIYNVYITRKEINERLKEQIKKMCPVLIKGALEEGE